MSGTDSRYLYDTDVIIDFIKGFEKASRLILNNNVKYISTVTVGELYAGVRDNAETIKIEKMLDCFEILDVNREIATTAGLLKNRFYRSHGLKLPDALIAATALSHRLSLRTLNIKHFPMFKTLKAAYCKT